VASGQQRLRGTRSTPVRTELVLFISVLSSLVLDADPDNRELSVLLPVLLLTPIAAVFFFEMGILDALRKLAQPDGYGRLGCIGRCQQRVSQCMDTLLGVKAAGEVRASTHEKAVAIAFEASRARTGEEGARIGIRSFWSNRKMRLNASAAKCDSVCADDVEATCEGGDAMRATDA
jgi:hypothetical protein